MFMKRSNPIITEIQADDVPPASHIYPYKWHTILIKNY